MTSDLLCSESNSRRILYVFCNSVRLAGMFRSNLFTDLVLVWRVKFTDYKCRVEVYQPML